MSKELFLEELQKHLEILEDQEQQDILQEYAQHIDIKIQNGQSEEDAIRDFGPVKELAAEILEAYHVKPDFGGERKKKGLSGPGSIKMRDKAGKLRELGMFLKHKAQAFFHGIGSLFGKAGKSLKGFCLRAAGAVSQKKNVEEESETEKTPVVGGKPGEGYEKYGSGGFSGTERNKGGRKTMETANGGKTLENRSFWQVLSGGCGKMIRGIGTLVRWCLRLFWNAFWIVFGVCAGCFTLFALFGFGALLVLRMQGYPLTGAVLVCLGSFLAGGGLSGFCFSLIWRKKIQKSAEKRTEKRRKRREHEESRMEDGEDDIKESDKTMEENEKEYMDEHVAETEERLSRGNRELDGEMGEDEVPEKSQDIEHETDWQGGTL